MTASDARAFQREAATWCPGCGDFGVLRAMQQAVAGLGLSPDDVVLVSGIGCSGKITSYFRSYGLHVMHGRTLPVATGVKLANRRLTVLAAGGDGDGYGIGLQHLMHAIRRNVDVTYVVMDNGVYGNTKGQTSPTAERGTVTGSSPFGAPEAPVSVLLLALAAGISFLAQGFAGDVGQLARLIAAGIRHRGFSLVNVISPCPTYDRTRTYPWWRDHLVDLDRDPTHDPASWEGAVRRVASAAGRVRGLVYRGERPSLEDALPGFPAEPLAAMGRPDPAAVAALLTRTYAVGPEGPRPAARP